MGQFQKSNTLWMTRSRSGREKIFATPEDMWAAFVEYTELLDANHMEEHKPQVVDKTLTDTYFKKLVPYTWKGFCLFCGVNSVYFTNFRNDPKRCSTEFGEVIRNIEECIFTQKFSGAAVNLFNANIIARDLGLIDKSIQETRSRVIETGLTKDEAKNISDGLEEEF